MLARAGAQHSSCIGHARGVDSASVKEDDVLLGSAAAAVVMPKSSEKGDSNAAAARSMLLTGNMTAQQVAACLLPSHLQAEQEHAPGAAARTQHTPARRGKQPHPCPDEQRTEYLSMSRGAA